MSKDYDDYDDKVIDITSYINDRINKPIDIDIVNHDTSVFRKYHEKQKKNIQYSFLLITINLLVISQIITYLILFYLLSIK